MSLLGAWARLRDGQRYDPHHVPLLRTLTPLHMNRIHGHADAMTEGPQPTTRRSPDDPGVFGAGLTEAEVRQFQKMLEGDCGITVPLPEAWSRAIELLTLVESLLEQGGVPTAAVDSSAGFALPRT